MTSILDRYGIKEVADVTFYKINDSTGKPERPVLYLDTLKVSTVEQTAENTEARGGKGNAMLISWDYNKEINVTLEDALFSAKSMAIMFGNGTADEYTGNNAYIMKTETFVAESDVNSYTKVDGPLASDVGGFKHLFELPNGQTTPKYNVKFYTEHGVRATNLVTGTKYFASYDLKVNGQIIEISANSFPGTYYVTGDTYARSETSGVDEFFQFIIPKAKVTSENTITLEAEGDPSVFNMNLRVLRPADGKMMKLVKYDVVTRYDAGIDTATLDHNHVLDYEDVINESIPVTIATGESDSTETIEGATQAIFDSDLITSVTFSSGTPTITVESGITEKQTTEVKVYNKDGEYLTKIVVTITVE